MTVVASGSSSERRSPLALERNKGHLPLRVTGSGISSLLSSPRLLYLQSVFRMDSSLLVGTLQKPGPRNQVTVLLGCNLLGAAVVYFFLYESSGLSLEAVDMVRPSTLHGYSSGLIIDDRCTKTRPVSHGTLVNGLRRVTRAVRNSRQSPRRRERAKICPLQRAKA